jgi:hypothetical protein
VPASVVANRASDDDAAFIVAQLAEGARRFLGRELPLAGALPDDACLEAALRAGMPLPDAAAGSPAAAAVEAMAARLLPTSGVAGPSGNRLAGGDAARARPAAVPAPPVRRAAAALSGAA